MAVKKQLLGLMTEGTPSTTYPDILTSYSLQIPWSSLQQTRGGPIIRNNAIDRAIAQAKIKGYTFRLRIFCGTGAPSWVKNMDGPPITIMDDLSGATGTVGRWWLPNFEFAYIDLQNKLAAIYDAEPTLREVVVSRSTTIYAEPCQRQGGSDITRNNLYDGGYDPSADRQSLRGAIASHGVWQQTVSCHSFNPFQVITRGGVTFDLGITENVMDYGRLTLPGRFSIQSNSLDALRFKNSTYQSMYNYMHSLGGRLAFQTEAIRRLNDLPGAINYAINIGASCVELPPVGWGGLITHAQATSYNRSLIANG